MTKMVFIALSIPIAPGTAHRSDRLPDRKQESGARRDLSRVGAKKRPAGSTPKPMTRGSSAGYAVRGRRGGSRSGAPGVRTPRRYPVRPPPPPYAVPARLSGRRRWRRSSRGGIRAPGRWHPGRGGRHGARRGAAVNGFEFGGRQVGNGERPGSGFAISFSIAATDLPSSGAARVNARPAGRRGRCGRCGGRNPRRGRHVEVEDVAAARDVEAARRDVGRDQQPDLAVLEASSVSVRFG